MMAARPGSNVLSGIEEPDEALGGSAWPRERGSVRSRITGLSPSRRGAAGSEVADEPPRLSAPSSSAGFAAHRTRHHLARTARRASVRRAAVLDARRTIRGGASTRRREDTGGPRTHPAGHVGPLGARSHRALQDRPAHPRTGARCGCRGAGQLPLRSLTQAGDHAPTDRSPTGRTKRSQRIGPIDG
jgi:hypothetical protein